MKNPSYNPEVKTHEYVYNSRVPLRASKRDDGTTRFTPNFDQLATPAIEKYARRLKQRPLIFLAREQLRLRRRLERATKLGDEVKELREQMVTTLRNQLNVVTAELKRRVT